MVFVIVAKDILVSQIIEMVGDINLYHLLSAIDDEKQLIFNYLGQNQIYDINYWFAITNDICHIF